MSNQAHHLVQFIILLLWINFFVQRDFNVIQVVQDQTNNGYIG